MELGIFPLVSMVALMALLGPGFWDKLDRARTHARARGPSGSTEVETEVSRTAFLPAFAAVALVAAALGIVGAWAGKSSRIGSILVLPSDALGFKSEWSLFTDRQKTTGWFVVLGRYFDGSSKNLLENGASAEHPPPFGRGFASARWRKYLVSLIGHQGRARIGHFLRFKCNEAVDRGGALESVELLYVSRSSAHWPPSGSFTQRSLGKRSCNASGLVMLDNGGHGL